MSQYSAPMAKPGSYGSHKTSGLAITSLVLGVLSFFCAIFTGIAAIIFGIVALTKISGSNGRLGGTGLAIGGIITGAVGCLWTLVMIGMLLPAVQQVRTAARRTQTMNNVRQIGLASLNFETTFQRLPSNIAPTNPDAGENLSWRVHVLPFLGHQDLYQQFNLNEAWDSPNNIKLLPQMPLVYSHPNIEPAEGYTVYQFPYSSASNPTPSMFVQGEQGVKFREITDGSSNTILVIETNEASAVPWTKPQDWQFDPGNPHRNTGDNYPGGFIVGFCDGSTIFMEHDVPNDELSALFTRSGGD